MQCRSNNTADTTADTTGASEVSEGGAAGADVTTDETEDDTRNNDDLDFEVRAKNVFEKYGHAFLKDVLPRLPKLPNGMILLGCNEQSPLASHGDLFKMRMFRPDLPISTSEVYEDGTVLRFTNVARLMTDDAIVIKFKLEAATQKVGVVDKDMAGLNATVGLFEMEDLGNMTLRAFLERKVKGKNRKTLCKRRLKRIRNINRHI